MSEIVNDLLLAMDDEAFPLYSNLCHYVTKPDVRANGVLRPDWEQEQSPDNLCTYFYGTVLKEHGLYRMWYYAAHRGKNFSLPPEMLNQIEKWPTENLYQGPLCYAESDDGVNWRKPKLNQLEFRGSSENNAMKLPHTLVSGATLIRDDADPDPDRRYKMCYEYFSSFLGQPDERVGSGVSVATAVSPDGLSWTMLDMPWDDEFVEQASFMKFQDRYVLHYQTSDLRQYFSEGGHNCGRVGLAKTSYDFKEWQDGIQVSFALPEPRDPSQRSGYGSYDQVHLGVGAANFGNVSVGLYGLWHSVNTKSTEKSLDLSCDLGLLISNDGVRFREPVKGHVFIDQKDSPCLNPYADEEYNTILCQSNGIFNDGDVTRIYHGRWLNTPWKTMYERHYGEIGMATIPRDRWCALGFIPEQNKAHAYTKCFDFDKDKLPTLNLEGGECAKVEIYDEKFRAIPEFSGVNAGSVDGSNGFDLPVQWSAGNLNQLNGQSIRLKILLEKKGAHNPKLYAVNLPR